MELVILNRILQHTDHPSVALMATAIMQGLMEFEYEQIVLTNREETILESELMIFSACLILCE